MLVRSAIFAISALPTLVVLCLSVQNLQPIRFTAFGLPAEFGLGLLLAAALISGALTGLSACRLWSRPNKNGQHLAEWAVQDAKLAAAIKSDREKQLEAKILTLEAALKSALKKS